MSISSVDHHIPFLDLPCTIVKRVEINCGCCQKLEWNGSRTFLDCVAGVTFLMLFLIVFLIGADVTAAAPPLGVCPAAAMPDADDAGLFWLGLGLVHESVLQNRSPKFSSHMRI
jgi:hypothetical protein